MLALTACGSDSPDDTAGSTPSTTTSPSNAATPSPSSSPTTPESPAPSNSGIVPDEAWSGVIKKFVPPLAAKSDTQVATAGRKVCADFEASPDAATAKKIVAEAQTALGLDATQSQIFATAAITHFCTPQSDAWTKTLTG